MAVKAPPPSPWVLDVHGFVDVSFGNTRVTGGGMLLYPTSSALVQPSIGVSLDIYKDKSGFINSFSVFAGIWNEVVPKLGSLQSAAGWRHWQEMDWWVGVKVGFAQHWTLTAQHLEFVFPSPYPTSFPPTGATFQLPTAVNDVFTLSFNDAYLGLPITFNPYFQIFYTERGGSTVIWGKKSDTYRLEAGIVPTISLAKPYGIPLTISAPIFVEFGPSDFWNRNDGTTNVCGTLSNQPCALSNLAYYSAGLQGKYTIDSGVVPKRLGTWYVKGGFQWYHITNEALLAAQTADANALYVVQHFADAKKDPVIWSGGVGFSW